ALPSAVTVGTRSYDARRRVARVLVRRAAATCKSTFVRIASCTSDDSVLSPMSCQNGLAEGDELRRAARPPAGTDADVEPALVPGEAASYVAGAGASRGRYAGDPTQATANDRTSGKTL